MEFLAELEDAESELAREDLLLDKGHGPPVISAGFGKGTELASDVLVDGRPAYGSGVHPAGVVLCRKSIAGQLHHARFEYSGA